MANKVWKTEVLTPHQKWKLRRFWKDHPKTRILSYIILVLLIGIIIGKCSTDPEIQEVIKEKSVEKVVEVERSGVFFLKARDPNIVGSYGDNFQWSGSKIKKYQGTAFLKADPENNMGSLTIEFNGSLNPEEDALFDGEIKIVMSEFSGQEDWQDNGIAKDILLFGNTGRGFNYLPKTKAEIAGWGKANLYLNNGIVLENLPAMFMYCDGIRNPDGRIAKENGELYNLDSKESVEFFDANEKELHFMMYSDDVDKSNFPNNAIFINIYFENVATN